jgi:crotonobetainyl-CoA:carnitine CoA-transferase CaiB-like acyl-CoA transferase
MFLSAGNVEGYAPNFCAFNRNKQSLTLDLQTAPGCAAFLRLAAQADVVVENFRGGVLDRLGIGWDALRACNPRIIYCSISGFSEDGPYADRPSFDTVGQALSGLLHLFTDPADPRMRGPTITDQMTGIQAANAITAALFARERSGEPARIDVSMLDSAITFMPDSFAAWTQSGVDMQPETRCAWSHSFIFMCADQRMIAVHVGGPERFWRGMIAATGHPEVLSDPRFPNRPARIARFSEVIDTLRPFFLERPRAEWMARMAEQDVPCAEVHTIPEAMADPEVQHMQLFRTETHPVHGEMKVLSRAARINGSREPAPTLPPLLGEDNDRVLRDFGFSEAEIAALQAKPTD